MSDNEFLLGFHTGGGGGGGGGGGSSLQAWVKPSSLIVHSEPTGYNVSGLGPFSISIPACIS